MAPWLGLAGLEIPGTGAAPRGAGGAEPEAAHSLVALLQAAQRGFSFRGGMLSEQGRHLLCVRSVDGLVCQVIGITAGVGDTLPGVWEAPRTDVTQRFCCLSHSASVVRVSPPCWPRWPRPRRHRCSGLRVLPLVWAQPPAPAAICHHGPMLSVLTQTPPASAEMNFFFSPQISSPYKA